MYETFTEKHVTAFECSLWISFLLKVTCKVFRITFKGNFLRTVLSRALRCSKKMYKCWSSKKKKKSQTNQNCIVRIKSATDNLTHSPSIYLIEHLYLPLSNGVHADSVEEISGQFHSNGAEENEWIWWEPVCDGFHEKKLWHKWPIALQGDRLDPGCTVSILLVVVGNHGPIKQRTKYTHISGSA